MRIKLRHDALPGHNIGRFSLSTTSRPPTLVKLKPAAIPPGSIAALDIDSNKRTPEQKAGLAKFYRENTDNPAAKAGTEVTAAKKALTDFEDSVATVMVMKETAQPRDAFILKRGEYDKPGDKVTRAVPAIFPPLPSGAPNNRLGLAQWLVSGEHPLTTRVWVNRAWEKFFGNGLVKTSENLGSQAEWPSHPELLDWLATEFVRLKWDMKATQKLIVMSATYRQSSQVTPQLLDHDPDNRLVARGPRIRLSAEAIRDQALAVSGLLVEKTGGPSVRPYMPQGVWDETSSMATCATTSPIKARASIAALYTIWKRTAAPPSMLLFDSPNREICTVKRSRTNTPLQALTLLNEVTYVESARQLAASMINEGGAITAGRIAWAFRSVTARQPSAEELKVLTAGCTARLARYQNDPEAAKKLIMQGATPPDSKFAPAELAALTVTANVLLNMDGVLTRE